MSLIMPRVTFILEIRLEGPPLEDFSPDKSVEIWWNDSTQRPNQSNRKRYAPRSSTSTPITIPDEAEPDSTLSLDEWDSWLDN